MTIRDLYVVMNIVKDAFKEFILNMIEFRVLPLLTIVSSLYEEYKLNEEDIQVLVKIAKTDYALVSTVANSMYISLSKASRIINDLVQKGLIQREYDDLKDRRKVKLVLSQKGQEILEQGYGDLLKFYNYIFNEIGMDKITEFSMLFKTFNQVAEKKIEEIIEQRKKNCR